MKAQEIDHMFHFKYLKSAGEIIEKAKEKALDVRKKIEEASAHRRSAHNVRDR